MAKLLVFSFCIFNLFRKFSTDTRSGIKGLRHVVATCEAPSDQNCSGKSDFLA